MCTYEIPKENSATGVVMDAAMHTLTIVNNNGGDTLTFSTMALRDSGKMISIFLGDTVNVEYPSKMEEEHLCYTALKVELVGRPLPMMICGGNGWVEPNPINKEQVQGFLLNCDGTAESIGMET